MDKIASIAQQLLQFSPDALIVVDSRGVILFANATSHGLFGYSQEQLVGQSIEMLVPERFRLRHGAHLAGYLRDPRAREMGVRIIDLFARRARKRTAPIWQRPDSSLRRAMTCDSPCKPFACSMRPC